MGFKEQKLEFSSYDLNHEKITLNTFLQSSGFYYDARFFGKLEKNDIIEVYTYPQYKQIYSNNEFKKICSYTNEQMKEMPFPELFWRDPEVQATLMRRLVQVCHSKKQVYAWNLPDHDLIENLHPKKRTFKMTLKFIAPCFRSDTAEIASAFVTTAKVTQIFEWSTAIT